jgi:hypothetical protein
MAANAQWVAFMDLVDIDCTRTDWLGEQARTLKTVLEKYMELRFNTTNTDYLVDIINDATVVTAVITSLTHVSEDDAAVKAAVAAVVPV